MYIDSKVYQVFFEILKKTFIEKEMKGKLPLEAKGDSSRSIWDHKGADNKSFRVLELFSGSRTDNHLYFQRKHEEFNADTSGGSIDNLSMMKALEYIGIKIPPEHTDKWPGKSAHEKAEILYHQFLVDYEKILPSKGQITFGGKGAPSFMRQGFKGSAVVLAEPENSAIMEGRLIVQKFYEHIAINNLESAWELLSEAFQKRHPWNGDFEKFEIGYTNTHAIKNISVFSAKQETPSIIECSVTYDDYILTYTNKELSNLECLSIADLDEFVRSVELLKQLFASYGIEHLERIEISRLFDPSASEYIWYKCGVAPERLPEIFNLLKTQVIKRLANATCCLIDGVWRINRIQSNKSISIR